MSKKKSTSRNRNNGDDACGKKKVKTCDNGDERTWSDLNHHVLYLVMMKLGFVEYLSFGGVCKSWRSFALSERNIFIASKPPMKMRISWRTYNKVCYLEDSEGKKFKTILPRFAGGTCVGLTCGYLIFFRKTTSEFWLVNPITRHELNFPNLPMKYYPAKYGVRAILVHSRSVCEWVLVVVMHENYSREIWFSIAGKGVWNHVSCTSMLLDLHFFKGKIYIVGQHYNITLSELRLYPEPKLTLFEIKNSLKRWSSGQKIVTSGENMYVMPRSPQNGHILVTGGMVRFSKLDFDEMKWVLHEKTVGEYASFLGKLKHGIVDKLELGYNNHGHILKLNVEKATSFNRNMWYFPHECFNVDLID